MEVENKDVQKNHASMNCSKYPQYCSNGKKKSAKELEKMRSNKPTAKTSIISATNNIGQPADPGNYCGGYCGQGGGLQAYTTGSGTYGDSIGSVPLSYSASYDVNVYDNLMVVTLHEQYWMPAGDIPNMDSSTFGGSVLVSQLNNGQQVKTNLGEFTPGRLGHPDEREHRDTSIQYYGRDNFPTALTVSITFGAENVKATRDLYTVPFSP
jgi:hypothetical protein